jgi:hypothetical protein
MQCVELVPNVSENVTNLFQLAKKVTNLFQIANKSDELIPNWSVEPVPIDKSCRLYSIWHTFELIPNGRVGLVQPPLRKCPINMKYSLCNSLCNDGTPYICRGGGPVGYPPAPNLYRFFTPGRPPKKMGDYPLR